MTSPTANLGPLPTTSQRRVIVARELPRRLQKRCEGLDPVSLRLTLAMMGVPEREIIRERRIRRWFAPPPPPPLGIGKKMPVSFGYPNPLTFPEAWIWVTPTISASITESGGTVSAWADQTAAMRNTTTGGGTVTVPETINGIPAIYFSGMSGGNAKTAAVSPGLLCFGSLEYFTCFSIIQPVGSINPVDPYSRVLDTEFGTGFTLCVNSAGTHWKLIVADTSSPYGTVEGGTPAVGTPALLTGIFNAGTATLQVNGTTVATGTFTSPTGNGTVSLTIASLSGSSGEGQSGYYGDQCLCVGAGISSANPQPAAALSGTTLTNANRFFGAEYGITVP